ncbi:MAG: DNA-3-methyladenine glycosylase, partial [Candidatus Microsaccharimonas sp.]
VMFGPAGFLYVYFTYGMHYCCNVVTGPEGHGEAVLIRAVQPLEGEDSMAIHRGGRTGKEISNGPAKVCQALAIDGTMNAHFLADPPLELSMNEPLAEDSIGVSTRVGLSRGTDTPWRFFVKANPYVSKA